MKRSAMLSEKVLAGRQGNVVTSGARGVNRIAFRTGFTLIELLVVIAIISKSQ